MVTRRRGFDVGLAAGSVVLLSALWLSPPAFANEESKVDVVANVAPTDVAAAVDSPLLAAGETEVILDELVIEAPSDATDGLSVSLGTDVTTIGLPFAESAEEGVSTDPGTVTFDNGNATSSVVIVHESGKVQVATVIDSADAPTRFEYPVETPDGANLVLRDGRAVVVDDTTGEVRGAFDAPWAKDANGKSVPTHYELNGQTLTQVVDHNSSFAYPVVADPAYATYVSYISNAGVVNMYNGLKGISNGCSVLPIPYPINIACLGFAPASEIEKAYHYGWRLKVTTTYTCPFNYCSSTSYKAVP